MLTKYAILFALIVLPILAQSAPQSMGKFTVTSRNEVNGSANGTYITQQGATGNFTITRNKLIGYQNTIFTPTSNNVQASNGIEIQNNQKFGSVDDAKDEFSYTFTIDPTTPNTIHTIKIGQATYDTVGNSEIARQTLNYTNFEPRRFNSTASATIRENPSVSYFYDAMGDYFMGKKINETNLQGNIAKSEPQLRINDSASNSLYYYNITNLNGTGNAASYTPTRTNDALKEVTLRTANAILPSPATFANILKSSAQPNTYRALRQGDVLGNGSTYVSYGIKNQDSNYVIDVRNAQSVTLKYEGIMNGNFAVNAPVVGETFKEWITFGVESEPAPNVIPAPPNANIVQCDAGYIYDAFASSDYDNLATTSGLKVPSVGSNKSIVGLKNESYVLVSNTLSSNETAVIGVSNSYESTTTASVPVFGFLQNFATKSGNSTVSYKFINKFTNQAQALNNVSLSVFDIDNNYISSDNFGFFDAVTIKGFTNLEGTGAGITPRITYGPKMTTSPPYRQEISTSGTVCENNKLDGNCQVSVNFNKNEVVRVDVTYGNNTAITTSYNGKTNGNPSDQYIGIRMDGYCYKPQPRITYSKELADPRKTDTDQFVVQIKDSASSVVTGGISSTTTAGEGNIVSDGTGTTGIFKVDPTRTYTLTEGIVGKTTLLNYKPSYECKNSDGIVVTDNPSIKLNYGDAWRCIITNSTPEYVISGIVFDDKGKVTDPSSDDVSATYISDSDYFNGKFNPLVESGIKFTSGHTITLDKCSEGGIFTPQTVNINIDGTYSFTVTPEQIGSNTKLCVTQNEPSNYIYSVDTTSNVSEINIMPNVYAYPRNDFGDVIQKNAALVLVKSQYLHDCSLTNWTTIGMNYEGLPTVAFSKNSIDKIEPGQCIAYRIEAINRGNVALTDIIISDQLQEAGVEGALITSTLINPIPVSENSSLTFQSLPEPIGSNRKLMTNGFSLAVTNPKDRKAIRFNTKYGNIVSP